MVFTLFITVSLIWFSCLLLSPFFYVTYSPVYVVFSICVSFSFPLSFSPVWSIFLLFFFSFFFVVLSFLSFSFSKFPYFWYVSFLIVFRLYPCAAIHIYLPSPNRVVMNWMCHLICIGLDYVWQSNIASVAAGEYRHCGSHKSALSRTVVPPTG